MSAQSRQRTWCRARTAANNITWCTGCSPLPSTVSPDRPCARSRWPTFSIRSIASSRNKTTWTAIGYRCPNPKCRTPDPVNAPTTPGRCPTSRSTSSRTIRWWTRPSGRFTNSPSSYALVLSTYPQSPFTVIANGFETSCGNFREKSINLLFLLIVNCKLIFFLILNQIQKRKRITFCVRWYFYD